LGVGRVAAAVATISAADSTACRCLTVTGLPSPPSPPPSQPEKCVKKTGDFFRFRP